MHVVDGCCEKQRLLGSNSKQESGGPLVCSLLLMVINVGRNLLQPAQAAGPQQVGDLVLWITCWFGRYRSYVQTLHKDLYYQVIGLEISKNMILLNIMKKMIG